MTHPLGARIALALATHGWTTADLARDGLDAGAVDALIEEDELARMPERDLLASLCPALGVPMPELVAAALASLGQGYRETDLLPDLAPAEHGPARGSRGRPEGPGAGARPAPLDTSVVPDLVVTRDDGTAVVLVVAAGARVGGRRAALERHAAALAERVEAESSQPAGWVLVDPGGRDPDKVLLQAELLLPDFWAAPEALPLDVVARCEPGQTVDPGGLGDPGDAGDAGGPRPAHRGGHPRGGRGRRGRARHRPRGRGDRRRGAPPPPGHGLTRTRREGEPALSG